MMRTLKFAILGLLVNKPMTGYDITKEFNFQLAQFWSASHSQIYPELKKLVNEGLINYDIAITGEILEKKLYSITQKGKEEFLTWLHIDEPMPKTPKDVFRLRMYFSNNMESSVRIHLIEQQLSQHKERLEFLYTQFARYPQVPSIDTPEFGDYLVLDGAITREKGLIEWLTKCLNLCKSASL